MSESRQAVRSSSLFSNYEFRCTFKDWKNPAPENHIYDTPVYTTGVAVIRTWTVHLHRYREDCKEKFKIALKKTSGLSCKANIWLECCKGRTRFSRTREDHEFSDENSHFFNIEEHPTPSSDLSYRIRVLLRLPEDDIIPYVRRLDGLHKFGSDMENMQSDDYIKEVLLTSATGDGARVHKIVASACSNELKMYLEANSKGSEELIIKIQSKSETIKEAVRFMYTRCIPPDIAENVDNFFELYSFASKMGMRSLQQTLVSRFIQLLTDDNVGHIIERLVKINNDLLMDAAMRHAVNIVAREEKKFIRHLRGIGSKIDDWVSILNDVRLRLEEADFDLIDEVDALSIADPEENEVSEG